MLRLTALSALALVTTYASPASAGVSIAQPAREATTRQPLEVTVIYSGDAQTPSDFEVPPQLTVTLTNGDLPPRPVTLLREPGAPDHLTLPAGQFRKIRYSAPWPDWARGLLKMDVVGLDVSPVIIALTRQGRGEDSHPADNTLALSAQPASAAQAGPSKATQGGAATPPSSTAPAMAAANTPLPGMENVLSGRFSTFEPIYFADGSNGANLARFQISMKYRIRIPDDPYSRGFLDNLYFAYTQMSLWDIRAHSSPFHDTSYMPQVFYYVPDTGWQSPIFRQMSAMVGLGHESNGQDGPESRSIDILFVRPTWEIGNVDSYHLTISPKVYYYLPSRKEDNPDIADYRGYVDLLIKYGSPDSWQLATTLRKGTKSWYGSIDTQLTYPLAKLFGNAWGGYLWLGYFNGYGESLLEYNQKHWIARVGLSLVR
jgi:outer membrane phospholipase A